MIHNDEIRIKCVGNFLSYVDAQLQGMCVAQECLIHSEVIIATGVALRLGRAVRRAAIRIQLREFRAETAEVSESPRFVVAAAAEAGDAGRRQEHGLAGPEASRAASCFCVAIA